MPKQKFDILFRSKVLVALIATVLLFLGVVQVIQGLIDTRDYREQIVQAIKEATGRDVIVKGAVRISLLPIPVIYVPGLELRNLQSNTPTPALTVEMLRINPAPFSLFSDRPEIAAVTFERPTLEIERAQDNVIHWDWLNADVLKKIIAPKGAGDVGIKITDGRILYRNNRTDKELAVVDINIEGGGGRSPEFNGTLNLQGRKLQIMMGASGVAAGDATPLQVKLFTDDKNFLQMQGTLSLSDDKAKVNGSIRMELEDLLGWTQEQQETESASMFEQITSSPVQEVAKKTAMPMKLLADWAQEGWDIRLSNLQLEGVNSAGTGNISLQWHDELVTAVDLTFSTLDFNWWSSLVGQVIAQRGGLAQTFAMANAEEGNPLPADVQCTLNLKADRIFVGEQIWQKAKISAMLEKAAVTVNELSIELPGESMLTLFGVVSQGSTGGLRFEGSMETQGKSLRNTLTVFDESAADLPETGFGAFYAHANIFVSPEQVRLSEASVKISDLRLAGGLVAYFDTNPRLEAEVRLRDINFDYFRDVWRQKQKEAGQQDFFLKFDKNVKFDWLKNLQTTIDFKVNVEQFTFLERQGDSASFRLFAKDGQFGIYNIRFYYPGEIMEANFSLDVNGEQPLMSILLNTNELNINYFGLDPAPGPASRALPPIERDGLRQLATLIPQTETIVQSPPSATLTAEDLQAPRPIKSLMASQKKWSEDLIDMSWMEGVSGAFDITIGNLIYHDSSIYNVKFKARLEKNSLTLETASFSLWQGRCDVTGSLYGGKVPGISIGFTLYDAELQDILRSAVGRENITGKTSISGTLTTSGVNYLSWVSQAEAKLVMAARGVVVQGLNLQGVTDAVAVSRTAADVFNNVNLALTDGSTEMSVDGNVNVRNGVMKTPGITLKTGIITGNLTGEIRLVPWTMDLSTFFQFPAMPSETVPTMTVQLNGPIDVPQLRTDTASLEAYVAKRIIGR
jgi:hypothetical protein